MEAPDRTRVGIGRQLRLAIVMLIAVEVLGSVNLIQSPEQAQRWLRAMLILPALLAGAALWYVLVRRSRQPAGPADERALRQYFLEAMTLAALAVGIRQIAVFGLEIWIRFGDHRADLEIERRLLGLASGAVFVVVGNALPKILTPLSVLPLHLAERVTSARRFIGMAWVVLGLAMMTAFLATPLAAARTLERWASIAGLLTMVGGIVWMNAGTDRRAAP